MTIKRGTFASAPNRRCAFVYLAALGQLRCGVREYLDLILNNPGEFIPSVEFCVSEDTEACGQTALSWR